MRFEDAFIRYGVDEGIRVRATTDVDLIKARARDALNAVRAKVGAKTYFYYEHEWFEALCAFGNIKLAREDG